MFLLKNKKILWILPALAVLLAVAAIFFWPDTKFPFQTTLCGLDVSGMTPNAAGEVLRNAVENYTLRLTIEGQSYTLTGAELSLKYTAEDLSDLVNTPSASSWEVMSVSEDAITDFLEANLEERREAGTAPGVLWDAATGRFVTDPGTPETWYSREAAAQRITEAVAQLQPHLELTAQDLLQKQDPVSELLETASALTRKGNALLEAGMTLEGLRDGEADTLKLALSGEDYASMLRFDVAADRITVDEAAALAVLGRVCGDYSVSPGNGNFISHHGLEVTIEVPRADLTVDVQDLYLQVKDHVENGLSAPVSVSYTSANGNPNFDGNYVEVSIPHQTLWVYQDGQMIIETGIVTGNYRGASYSPVGLRQIWSHREDVYLYTDAYFSEYWMAVVPNELYGFHDADNWREVEEYGGDTYLNNGSGGCINVPLSVIPDIYAAVPNGTPVVIYDHSHVGNEIGYDIIIKYYTPYPIELDAAEKYPGATITYTVSNPRLGEMTEDGKFQPKGCGGSYITAEVQPADGSEPVTLKYFVWIRLG